MKHPFLKGFDPVLQLITLLVLSFVAVSLMLLLGNLLVQLIWGIEVFSNLNILSDFAIPEVIHANKLLLLLQHLGMFVLPPLLFAKLVSTGATDFLYLRQPFHPSHWIFAIAAMFLALMPINVLVEWNAGLALPESLRWLEEMMQSAEKQAEQLTEALLAENSGIWLLLNIVLIAVVPAIGEELMFRGAIQRIISQWTRNAHIGIWVSAIIFSAIHFQFYGFIPRMALGALFGYMLIWSGSMWLPVVAHFINNATAIIVLHFIQKGAISAEVDSVGSKSDEIYAALISVILLVIVLWVWRKRSLWGTMRDEYVSK